MQKAHLYEAIFLVNQGIDQPVRGLTRLKKAAGIGEEIPRLDTLRPVSQHLDLPVSELVQGIEP